MVAMLVALPCLAIAQVIEVRPDGSVINYDGPTQFLSTGAKAINPAAPERRAGRRAGGPPPPDVAQAIHAASARHQVSEDLVSAVAWQESGFNSSAVSPKGARGVMQLMPQTARQLGVNAADPVSNIDGGAAYLASMLRRFDGDTRKALAAYNAGPGAVERYRGVPPYAETTAYVSSILHRLDHSNMIPLPAEEVSSVLSVNVF
jgi:soluble lytic murein transglycosylase-like protein